MHTSSILVHLRRGGGGQISGSLQGCQLVFAVGSNKKEKERACLKQGEEEDTGEIVHSLYWHAMPYHTHIVKTGEKGGVSCEHRMNYLGVF